MYIDTWLIHDSFSIDLHESRTVRDTQEHRSKMGHEWVTCLPYIFPNVYRSKWPWACQSIHLFSLFLSFFTFTLPVERTKMATARFEWVTFGQVWMSRFPLTSSSPHIDMSHELYSYVTNWDVRWEDLHVLISTLSPSLHLRSLSLSRPRLNGLKGRRPDYNEFAARLQWVQWQLVVCIQFVTRIHRSKRAIGAPEHLQKERRLGLNESRDSFARVAHTVRSHSSWLMWQIEHESWMSHVTHVYRSKGPWVRQSIYHVSDFLYFSAFALFRSLCSHSLFLSRSLYIHRRTCSTLCMSHELLCT